MAINPNTDFTVGQVATADQMNRFPRGIMQRVASTATYSSTGPQTITLTSPSFTAVANRYYRITYFEPYFETTAANVETVARIRLNNISGTVLGTGVTFTPPINGEGQIQAVFVGTLTAGSTVVVSTIQTIGGNAFFYGSTDYNRLLWIEDIGPA